MGYYLPATEEDARDLAPRLREADRREIIALTGMVPEAALPLSLGPNTWAGFSDAGELALLFGCNPVAEYPDVGVVWLVGNDLIARRPREFHSVALQWLDQIHAKHPILTNMIDERNRLHMAWLRRLGFVFLRRIERWGAESRPFIEFARTKTLCASHSSP